MLGGSLLVVNGVWAQNKQSDPQVSQSPVVHTASANSSVPVVALTAQPEPRPTVSPRPVPTVAPTATPVAVTVSVVVPSQAEAAAPTENQAPAETPVAEQANDRASEKRPSGIKGTMFIGPTCPTVQISVDGTVTNNDCAPNRYDGTAGIYNAETNELVTEVTANNGGNFIIDLAPGTYYATTVWGDRIDMTFLPMTDRFTVNEVGYTDVTFMFDNGLR